tara:strand:+ start:910 stop:1110 length:201 start_codon:yes stop_codon:yes gene_type:complete
MRITDKIKDKIGICQYHKYKRQIREVLEAGLTLLVLIGASLVVVWFLTAYIVITIMDVITGIYKGE